MHKIGQSGGFLGRLLGLLLKTGLSLIKIVLKPLAKSLLVSLRLTVATSAKNGAILESGIKPLIMLNYEINNVMKIVKSLAEFGPLIKGVSETIKIEKKDGFIRMPLGIFDAILSGNLLTGKGRMRANESLIRAGRNV